MKITSVPSVTSGLAPHLPGRVRVRLFLFVLACIIYVAGRAPFIGQWDSFDYLKEIVTHRLSDLGFGRPVFIGFNIALWETLKRIFRLEPLQVEGLAMGEIILLGAVGILIFDALTRRLLSPSAHRIAVLALLLSPMYALYSGFVMTEIPMLVALVSAALILWPSHPQHRFLRDAAGGVVYGLAVGIREQAITFGAVYLWMLWVRRSELSVRLRSIVSFGTAAALVTLTPVAVLYLSDPAAFSQRMQVWLRAIPTGQAHFWGNLQATILYTFAVCPAAWLATFAAGMHCWLGRRGRKAQVPKAAGEPGNPGERPAGGSIPAPAVGVLCALVLPVMALWRDADVQIHPRYALIALPASLILCAHLYSRWASSRRAAVNWVIFHLAVFGIAQVGMHPLRQIQTEKREFTEMVRKEVPGEALLIPGGYSPIMDYYRAVGERPQWQVLWSGWGWQGKAAETTVRKAWSRHVPVYLCEGPAGWLYFEDELLDLHFVFKNSRKEVIAPGLLRIYPDYWQPR